MPNPTNFAKGGRVEIFGLKNATELNEKYGTLLGFQKKVDRWRVRCDDLTTTSMIGTTPDGSCTL